MIRIRQERKDDHTQVFNIITNAFKNEEYSDHREQFLVDRLRKTDAFIPELSLVAESDNKIVGHILLTRLEIRNKFQNHEALALAPVSVLPEYQNKGIGSSLILKAHEIAKKLDFSCIVLLGHEKYYPRFGYRKAEDFNIEFPFDAPSENCMVMELKPGELEKISGIVTYPEEFFK